MVDIENLHEKHGGILGYRQMTLFLNRQYKKESDNPTVNRKRVYRLMKHMGIKAIIRQRNKSYKPSNGAYTAENILNRNFKASQPNEKWLTDVTEFRYGKNSKAYLSAILDLNNKRIVSYKIGRANNNELVFDTLNEAIEGLSGEHLLLHSDRGVQYTSYGFKRIMANAELQHSMSRPGKCIDNGPMESFWGTLKCEMYYLHKWGNSTFEELVQAIHDYIYFYNYERYQLNLGGLAPMEYLELSA